MEEEEDVTDEQSAPANGKSEPKEVSAEEEESTPLQEALL